MNYTNQLINESSPYLLQHANNPVNWLPFGEEAFALAKKENKPLLISIGYSSCHWCHVMEHESFEDEAIAKLMNDLFICVKVDREERLDVDHAFMDAVQQIHGNGGWPLNCFTLPDGRPFWGGTYFKPQQWKQLLLNIINIYTNRFSELEKQATEISAGVARLNYLVNDEAGIESNSLNYEIIYDLLHNAFDIEKGGMRGSPKFPMPVVLRFMLQYGTAFKDADAYKMVELTLHKMAYGGIYDQVGGGFARYSTDAEWKVPHFEKMLYDNAQLVSLYAKAFQLTGNVLYKTLVEQTIGFVESELCAPEGVFYTALDADSDGEEGLYYTWKTDEFNEALGHYAQLAGKYYGINDKGLWENDRNILLRPESDELFAQQHFLSAEELISLTDFCRTRLLKARSARTHPALDDKMLVSWNSLMISALIDASVSLDRSNYLEAAIKAAEFLVNNLKRPDGGLFHTWKKGQSQISGFLDDYAFTCEAFIKLYAVTTNELWLKEADSLLSFAIRHLFDSNSGFFWYSENKDNQVFARKIETYDGVIPSGNSTFAHVLHALGIFLHNEDYTEKAAKMLFLMTNRINRSPAAYAKWASLALASSGEQYLVAVVGENAVSIIKELTKKMPDILIFGSCQKSELPYFENRFIEGKTLIYICSGTHCLAPVETIEEVINSFEKRK